MKISYSTQGLVRWKDDGTGDIVDLPFTDVGALLRQHPDEWRKIIADSDASSVVIEGALEPVSPVAPTSAVWGVGLNYWSRARSSGRDPAGGPTIFLRASSTGAVSGGCVALPRGAEQVDYEGELAVVIGRDVHQIESSESWGAVALLAPANDMTARDVMRRTSTPALAKSFPGFGPIGSTLATPDSFADPDDVGLITLVNGEVRQQARTSDMVRGVAELVALVSSYVWLRAGDVILTGSPAGTGDEAGCYLQPGDVVEVSIDGLPPVRSTMEAG